MNKQFWHRNASTILTCLGGVGVVTTAVFTAKATPKAIKLLEEAKEEKGEELSKWEVVKVTGKVYIPAVVTGAATLGCIFGANVLNKRNQAALVSAYALIDSSFTQYKRKLVELYGEDTHKEIVDAIAVEKAEDMGVRAPGFVDENTLFVDERCGETRLFYDEYSNRYFETTLEQVISSEYHLNRNYTLRGYTVLNEFYEFLGIEQTKEGEVLGWVNRDAGMEWIEFNHRPMIIGDDLECLVIEMPFAPDLDWQEDY